MNYPFLSRNSGNGGDIFLERKSSRRLSTATFSDAHRGICVYSFNLHLLKKFLVELLPYGIIFLD